MPTRRARACRDRFVFPVVPFNFAGLRAILDAARARAVSPARIPTATRLREFALIFNCRPLLLITRWFVTQRFAARAPPALNVDCDVVRDNPPSGSPVPLRITVGFAFPTGARAVHTQLPTD